VNVTWIARLVDWISETVVDIEPLGSWIIFCKAFVVVREAL
jgi:hypothetical protein